MCAAQVLIISFLLVGIKLFGLQPYTVLSGSMEPEYPTGSMIYVKEAEPYELNEGDVITFRLGGQTIGTHRIIEVVEEDGLLGFRTKGDANKAADHNLVRADQVIGTPVFTIPGLGRLATFVQSSVGKAVSIAVIGSIILMIVLAEIVPNNRKENENNSEA